jgi:pyruvate/2-oxoglutarate dehydrogenase complex dihydrolipoamide dehydrogenase (E3) component
MRRLRATVSVAGSTVAAWTFASEGKRIAVVDRKYIGGFCANIAGLPGKSVIHSAKAASYVRHSGESVLPATASPSIWTVCASASAGCCVA